MTTARSIITGALTFGLNKLSPGETLDPDVAATCLTALNNIVDGMNGGKAFLFREIISTSSAITGASASLGTEWTGLVAGDKILGATVTSSSQDNYLPQITMAAYANIADKTTSGTPSCFAHDGSATVYLYPAATGQTVKLRTKQVVSDFAALDTDYTMPKGFKSGLSALLAVALAPVLAPDMAGAAAKAAFTAKLQMMAQTMNPAILGQPRERSNILTG